jgi:pimeloyl-ACP methyl ester carboxylesterase
MGVCGVSWELDAGCLMLDAGFFLYSNKIFLSDNVHIVNSKLKIVLLPGLDGTGMLFSPFTKVLPEALTPIIISYPKDLPLDYDDLDYYLAEQIPAEEPFVILGESFSGPLALRFAAKNPKNLVAVILCATFIENPVSKMSACFSPVLAEKMFQLPLPPFFIRHLLLGKDAPDEMMDTFREVLNAMNPQVLAARIKSVFAVNAKQALLDCSKPILYLLATRDQLLSRKSFEQIQSLRPDVEVAAIDAPHLLLQCAPQQASGAIQSFLKRRITWR